MRRGILTKNCLFHLDALWNLDFQVKNLKQLESSLDTQNKSLLAEIHSEKL